MNALTSIEANHRPERLDLRSYARQGIDKIPTVHMGAAVCQMEKKGIQTNIGNLNRDIKAANSLMQSIRQMVRHLKGWIADLKEKKAMLPEALELMIKSFLDSYPGDTICSKQLYKEALNRAFDEPKQWEIREINEIMNQCVTGWKYFSNPRMFAGYGRQKGWEREQKAKADACALTADTGNGAGKTPEAFTPVPEQMKLPF